MSEARPGIIYTDGASLGNPGPAGAGFVITDQRGGVLKEGSIPLGRATCNVAEYQAVISALEAAAELGLSHLVIRSDSELLCKQMWGRYRVKNSALKRLHIRARRVMESFEKVVFEHVPRERNRRADALAGEAAAKAKELPPEAGPPRLEL